MRRITHRWIAGHANALGGEPILWLIGVDQQRGLEGADYLELANWYPQVVSQFDGQAPAMTDVNIQIEGVTVVALLFETNRVPFVVKNPVFGTPGGGPVQREVPWREGTSTRSATHADLIRLLVPLQKLPNYEVLAGQLYALKPAAPDDAPIDWTLHLAIYIEPKSEGTMVIPFHRCQASFQFIGDHSSIEFGFVSLKPPTDHPYNIERRSRSLTIESSNTEILIGGPGLMLLTAIARLPMIEGSLERAALIQAQLQPSETDQHILVTATLAYAGPNKMVGFWRFGKEHYLRSA